MDVTISIKDGQLIGQRRYDVLVVFDSIISAWQLPANVRNLAVYVNGLRYRQGLDYFYDAATGRLTAATFNMQPGHTVVADFDPTSNDNPS